MRSVCKPLRCRQRSTSTGGSKTTGDATRKYRSPLVVGIQHEMLVELYWHVCAHLRELRNCARFKKCFVLFCFSEKGYCSKAMRDLRSHEMAQRKQLSGRASQLPANKARRPRLEVWVQSSHRRRPRSAYSSPGLDRSLYDNIRMACRH